MSKETIIGVDLGGTKVQSSRLVDNVVIDTHKTLITSQGAEETVIKEVIDNISRVFEPDVSGIGLGVPGLVDEDGILYDIQNIPSWKKVPLKDIIEAQFGVPIYINNDANCFALGEKYFGKGQGKENLLGLILGTGLAAGIVINHKLYNGHNCGAGEFGMIPYLEHNYEYYATGQFFKNVHQLEGPAVYEMALQGDARSLEIFQEFGVHVGNSLIAILYAVDPEIIVLGGSVGKTYELFQKSMWETLENFAYSPVIGRLTIEVSENPDIAVLGAAALIADAKIGN